jgi:hypothetical protein
LNFAQELLECLFFCQELRCVALFWRFFFILCPLLGQFLLISLLGTKWTLLLRSPFTQRYAITSVCYIIWLMLFVPSQCRSKHRLEDLWLVLFTSAFVIDLQYRRLLTDILHTTWIGWVNGRLNLAIVDVFRWWAVYVDRAWLKTGGNEGIFSWSNSRLLSSN